MAGIKIKMSVDPTKKVERLRRGTGVTFNRFVPQLARETVRKHKPGLERALKRYAKKLPDQKYKRTFKLRRGWKVTSKIMKTSFIVETTNKTPYTHWVVGKVDLRTKAGGKGQAKIHQGRWWLAGNVVRRHYNKMQVTYETKFFNTLEDQAGVKVKRRSKLLK